MRRARVVTLVAAALVLLVCLVRYRPPAAAPADAPPDTFSATRAQRVQQELAAHGSRAVGTAAHDRARDYLVGELAHLGWQVSLQQGVSCGNNDACAHVANIVATWPGTNADAGTVLLMAHYDSVPCSPGGGDDGFGSAAVVEAARAIAAGPPAMRGVVLVLTDGEEAGLLGAHLFAREHPLFAGVRAVVNVDSRGSDGPSAMFETSAGNDDLVARFARASARPVTSSLFYEIYRRMPNDTDFTTVRTQKRGVNLANIGGVTRYHTSRDTFAEADPGTLQHHGEQALGMVRSFAAAGPELDAAPGGDAVWFDVLALFVVRWPAPLTPGLAVLSLALALVWTARHRAALTWRGLAAPLAALVAALVAAFAVGGLLQGFGALPVPWVAHPVPALAAMHCASIAAGLLAARLVAGSRATSRALASGTWLVWSAIGMLLALRVPGASFLFVVPALAAGLTGMLREDVAPTLPALVTAVVWLPIALLVYDGLGFAVPSVACVTTAFVVMAFVPLFAMRQAEARTDEELDASALTARRLFAAGYVAVAIATVVAIVVPRYSTRSPQRVNVVFRQDGLDPAAHVFVESAWSVRPWGVPPAAMVQALGDPAQVTSSPPWPWSPSLPGAPTPRLATLEPPELTLVHDPSGDAILHVRSRRAARTFVVAHVAGPPLPSAVVDGRLTPLHRATLFLRGVPPEGATIRFVRAAGTGAHTFAVHDVTPGLPADSPTAQAVKTARPDTAVETQEGDVTLVGTQATLDLSR